MGDALRRSGLKGKELAQCVGISETQLSMFRSGKIKGVRFSTVSRMCAVLNCQLSDIMTYDFSHDDLEIPQNDDED